MAEAGDVQLVVRQPEGPFTRLLFGSIPLPDPDEPWQGERALGQLATELQRAGDSYCAFHRRCRYAMPICVKEAPPLFRTAPHRVSACYLYREAPALAGDRVGEIFGSARREQTETMPIAEGDRVMG